MKKLFPVEILSTHLTYFCETTFCLVNTNSHEDSENRKLAGRGFFEFFNELERCS